MPAFEARTRVEIGYRSAQQFQLATVANALLSAARIEQDIVRVENLHDRQLQLLRCHAQTARLVRKINANVERRSHNTNSRFVKAPTRARVHFAVSPTVHAPVPGPDERDGNYNRWSWWVARC